MICTKVTHCEVTSTCAGKISCRFKATGKWVNAYCGVEPNNEYISFPGVLNWLVKDGKVTDSWIYQSYAGLPHVLLAFTLFRCP